MGIVRTDNVSFAGGEVTSEMFGRVDDAKYQTGLALCSNFFVKPHGPITNRPGTTFVHAVKDSAAKVRVIPYIYSTTQNFCLEVGAGYFRFHTQGSVLEYGTQSAWVTGTSYAVGALAVSGGTTYYCRTAHTSGTFATDLASGYWYAEPSTGEYEVPHAYAEDDLFDLHYVQENDVLTIVHPSYAPAELRRYGATDWRLVDISFAPALSAPTGVTAAETRDSTHTTIGTYRYCVTVCDSLGQNESLASASVTRTNYYVLSSCDYNTISWTASTGTSNPLYNVYKYSGGIYGYIGQTSSTSLVDDGITADISRTPPIDYQPFSGSDNYPGAVSYFEQRRCFAGTNNKPQNLWMTRSGTESDLRYSLPTRDDDSISFRVAAREANTIRHLVPLTNLLLLTSASEWRVTSLNSDAITPSSVSVRPQAYVGASNVQPVVINNNVIYAAARGGHLREMAYSWQANGFVTGDLCLRAPHLFDSLTIPDMGYAKSPFPVIWSVSSSGKAIGCTYVPEQQIGAMHQHVTATKAGQSYFESVCVVPEGDIDAVYFVVRRVINGSTVRLIERLGDRAFETILDAYFVDCGSVLDCGGVETSTVSGLDWLEGETVNVLTDGAVHPQCVVSGGAISLDYAATDKIVVGLPILAKAKTLPISYQTQGYGQGRQKNVNKAWIRVDNSSGIRVGPSFDNLTLAKQRTTEAYGTPPNLLSEEVPVMLTPTWADNGAVCIEQSDPLPLTVVSMCLELSTGGA
jgi:hypothetical protein